jgi:MoaA/NifB/PqqE/SkfB family radical SAM enzyme
MFAVIAITKKCPLQCEHCYEWKNLNGKEVISVNDLNEIVARIQRKGVGQIQFTGGEPLNRMEALLDVLRKAESSTDFWVTTSGYNLTHTNALKLKLAGLTGVVVSLDHFIPEKHNSFRGNSNSFHWVEEAIKNANANNLVTALSLCVTNDFVSKENLMAYFELAKRMNISFVQILEPKQVGRYEHNEVSLTDDQVRIVEDFVMDMNFNTEYRDYPCIIYHAYHNRRHGCLSAGHKGVYIDSDGDLNPCPFCHKKYGSVLDEHFEESLDLLKASGCREFKQHVS